MKTMALRCQAQKYMLLSKRVGDLEEI